MNKLFSQLTWPQVQEFVSDLITDHWVKILVGALIALAGGLIVGFRQWINYQRREFLKRTNLSLNFFRDNKLCIRTIFEMDLDEILFNRSAITLALRAARRTTKKDPFFNLKEDDQWFINNAILNELAERFSEGQLAADTGQPTITVTYILGVTCEKDGDLRTRKIRVMLIRETLLNSIAQDAVAPPMFEVSYHHVRWQTLRVMASLYRREKEEGEFHRLMPIQITVRDMRHLRSKQLDEPLAPTEKPEAATVE